MKKNILNLIIVLLIITLASCENIVNDLFGINPEDVAKKEKADTTNPRITQFLFRVNENDFLDSTYAGHIDNDKKTITISLPFGYHQDYGDTLIPYIIGDFKSIYPNNLVARQFYTKKDSLKYYITDTHGVVFEYTLIVNSVFEKDTSIKSFKFEKKYNRSFSATNQLTDINGVIDLTNKTIYLAVKQQTLDYSSEFTPTIEINSDSIVTPSSLTPLDFSTPKQYTVSVADGSSSSVYTVQVLVESQSRVTIDKVKLRSFKKHEYSVSRNISFLNRYITHTNDDNILKYTLHLSPAEYMYFKDKYLQFDFISNSNSTSKDSEKYVRLPYTFEFVSADGSNSRNISFDMAVLPIPIYAIKSVRGTEEKKVVPYNFLNRSVIFNYDAPLNSNDSLRLYFIDDAKVEDMAVSYSTLGEVDNFNYLKKNGNYIELSDFQGIPYGSSGVLNISNDSYTYSLGINIADTQSKNLIDHSILQADFYFDDINYFSQINTIEYSDTHYNFDAVINDYFDIAVPQFNTLNETEYELDSLNTKYIVSGSGLKVYAEYEAIKYEYIHSTQIYPQQSFDGEHYLIFPNVDYDNDILKYSIVEDINNISFSKTYNLYSNNFLYSTDTFIAPDRSTGDRRKPCVFRSAPPTSEQFFYYDYVNYSITNISVLHSSTNQVYRNGNSYSIQDIDNGINIALQVAYTNLEDGILFTLETINANIYDSLPLYYSPNSTKKVIQELRKLKYITQVSGGGNHSTCTGATVSFMSSYGNNNNTYETQVINYNNPTPPVPEMRLRAIPNHEYKIRLNRTKFLQNSVEVK